MELKTLLDRLFKALANGRLMHLRSPIILQPKVEDGSSLVIKETSIDNGYEYKEILIEYISHNEMYFMYHGMPTIVNGEIEICPSNFFSNDKCVYNFILNKTTHPSLIRLISEIIFETRAVFILTCYDDIAEEFDSAILCRCIVCN